MEYHWYLKRPLNLYEEYDAKGFYLNYYIFANHLCSTLKFIERRNDLIIIILY